ncbi:MAG: transposase [Bacteroidales bacterium]
MRKHLKNRVSVSKLCEKYDIHPNVFYHWEKKELSLQEKTAKQQEVVAWRVEENIKKSANGDI